MLILFERLSLNIFLLVTVAYMVSKTKVFNRIIRGVATKNDKLVLIILFSTLSIIGTYIGLPIKGALANTRVVGVVMAGLLGGPVVGLLTGMIAGIHRILIGGSTAISCGIATIISAYLAGYTQKKRYNKVLSWRDLMLVGLIANLIEMSMIIMLTRPFLLGFDIVRSISIPMLIMNTFGMIIFYSTSLNSLLEEERVAALQAQKVLEITNLTLSILRMGLDESTAQQVAKIIYEKAEFVAVSITDRRMILAHIGKESNHHRAGLEINNNAVKRAIETGEITLAKTKIDIGCPEEKCTLKTALVVPLILKEYVVATITIYREKVHEINQVDWEFAKGLGRLFSTQLELSEIDVQTKLIAKAELKALEAQINPHFLFNAINTIVSLIRTNPEKAKKLLIKLGDIFRRNLQGGGRIVSLREEIAHITDYMAIEEARFGDRIYFAQEISSDALQWQLPSLMLQPLVENAVKHGIYPLMSIKGEITLYAKVDGEFLVVTIKDNGIGISQERLEAFERGEQISQSGLGIGLNNVRQRLKYQYYGDAHFDLKSKPGQGTMVFLKIPRIVNLEKE